MCDLLETESTGAAFLELELELELLSPRTSFPLPTHLLLHFYHFPRLRLLVPPLLPSLPASYPPSPTVSEKIVRSSDLVIFLI